MKPLPYFDSQIGEEDQADMKLWREEVARTMNELLEYGRDTFSCCAKRGVKAQRHADIVLMGFARHILAYLDCIAVLLGQGCSEGCTPLLRSILEAYLGIAHIVKERSEERARSYTLMLARNEINRLQVADKSHPKGQKVHAKLAADLFTPNLLDKMPSDLKVRADKLQAEIDADSAFLPIVTELESIKWKRPEDKLNNPDKKDPEWYRLFGTANTVADWMEELGCASFYTFMYKPMSQEAHGGTVVRSLYAPENTLRPLRYPDDLHGPVELAFQLFGLSFEKLTQFYGGDLGQTFRNYMVNTMYKKMSDLTRRLRAGFKHFR